MADSLEPFPSPLRHGMWQAQLSLLKCLSNDSYPHRLSSPLHSSEYLSSMFYLPQKSLLENHHEITPALKAGWKIWKLKKKKASSLWHMCLTHVLSFIPYLLLYLVSNKKKEMLRKVHNIGTDLPVCPVPLWCLPLFILSFLTSLCPLFLAEIQGCN